MSSIRHPHPHAEAPSDGLTVATGHGFEKVLMSEQELCDDVLATVHKLKAAVHHDTFGRKWKVGRRKNGVDFFELTPGGIEDGEDDLDVAHAVVAKTELHCHLNEVLNVLVHRDSDTYAATMSSLCGRSFKDGRQLYQQRRALQPRSRAYSSESSSTSTTSVTERPQTALVTVNLATLRPKLTVKFSTRHKRTQKLAFASCTVQYPSKDRAFHVVKTLPKPVHDEVVSSDDRTSLRREIDHIAMGIDIRTKVGGYSSSSHTTRVFAHAYASTVRPEQYGRYARKQRHIAYSASDLARHRSAIMNPEARTVLEILTKSLREYESIIRRRRFGFQTFVFFPMMHEDGGMQSCTICQKHFSFFRKDFFCQLCGHTVCGECSRLYDVEVRIGALRKNRCCIQCVVRVDACVFDDEDIVPALAPLIVDAWDEDDDDTVSIGSADSSVAESLYSTDPTERSLALERLAQLISPTSSTSSRSRKTTNAYQHYASQQQHQPPPPPPGHHVKKNPTKVMRDLEHHLARSMRVNKDKYRAEDLPVAGNERDYLYEYDSSKVSNPNIPLAPVPTPEKEARRLQLIKESGVLSKDYDRSALNMLAQIAAKKMNCPIGFVSVVDENHFHCIGNHNLPPTEKPQPRNENMCMHNVYAEAPLIVKNPQRDMRFAQMDFVSKLGVKFYAGFPIKAPDGSVVGSLCTGDLRQHNNITTKDYATMEALSKLAADLIVPNVKPTQQMTQHYSHQQQHMYSQPGQLSRKASRTMMPAY